MFPGGQWYNELGSQMLLNVSGSSVWGSYYSGVGTAQGGYPIAGRIDSKPQSYGQALGWAVAWENPYLNAHSATSWSGQYQMIDGAEEIVTLWLLTSETTPQDDWGATLVGKDVFTRTKPSDEEIARNRRRQALSHPDAVERLAE